MTDPSTASTARDQSPVGPAVGWLVVAVFTGLSLMAFTATYPLLLLTLSVPFIFAGLGIALGVPWAWKALLALFVAPSVVFAALTRDVSFMAGVLPLIFILVGSLKR